MSRPSEDRIRAAQLPEDDVVRILLEQHARIRELFAEVKEADGERRKQGFDELRALLAVHETGEEIVLRPVTREVVGAQVADARNREEEQATRTLAELEKMDASSAQFIVRLAEFERSVLEHAEREEQEEFPPLRARCPQDRLETLGRRLRRAEKVAPTHAHPVAVGSRASQAVVGPFASIVDRVRDALK